MKTSQATRAIAILESLPPTTKRIIYEEILSLAHRITYGQVTWHSHIRFKQRRTKGDLKRFFSALTNFTPVDVQVFLDAFLVTGDERK